MENSDHPREHKSRIADAETGQSVHFEIVLHQKGLVPEWFNPQATATKLEQQLKIVQQALPGLEEPGKVVVDCYGLPKIYQLLLKQPQAANLVEFLSLGLLPHPENFGAFNPSGYTGNIRHSSALGLKEKLFSILNKGHMLQTGTDTQFAKLILVPDISPLEAERTLAHEAIGHPVAETVMRNGADTQKTGFSSLSEGIATYVEQLATGVNPHVDFAKNIREFGINSTEAFAVSDLKPDSTVPVSNWARFTLGYAKPASFIHLTQGLLGPESLLPFYRDYTLAHKADNQTTMPSFLATKTSLSEAEILQVWQQQVLS